MKRHTGLLLPVFSAASRDSWGIGELPDLGPLARWAARCGCDRLMLLPIGTMAPEHHSPYSAASSMAIDPIFVALPSAPDFLRAGGETGLSAEARADLATARASAPVDYRRVRRVKHEALDRAFDHFVRAEWARQTARAAALAGYVDRERWWLDDYALFQVLTSLHPTVSWREWPPALRDREPAALDAVRERHGGEILRHQYFQWIAEEQWRQARASAESAGVAIFGDVPFVVNLHSADVWTRADEFLPEISVGTPPDAFSATGQDWSLPAYRWDVVAERGYPWIRQRARRMAALFGGLRIDHVIGCYRTYGRRSSGEGFFMPADEPAQLAQGEAVLRIFQETGAVLIAEDLGTVPDFLRPSLARLGVPGSKVLRWERAWHVPGQPFLDPAEFAPQSCALTSTHDTETLPDWYDHADLDERAALLRLPLLSTRGFQNPHDPWSPALGDALLELAWSSGSTELFVTPQDLFGWRDRINVPATVGEHNWTWRLPWPVDALDDVAATRERAAFASELTGRYRQKKGESVRA